ncbi:MAG: ATP:cob(I)alamin adenosyltransferase [Candidatus Hydrogenedentes bacterium]|nr:ATP:cob(I)alamin adenosyltransferase [Candidatus Hydrogenedentota bacterium]
MVSAHADVACTVARRLERSVVRLKELMPTFEATHVLVFLNRLSDYLFILARDLEQGRYSTLDYRVLE